MTLPAVAAKRRRLLSIHISCPQGAQQQTRRTLLLLAIDGTDRRADWSLDRFIDYSCSACYTSSVERKQIRFLMKA